MLCTTGQLLSHNAVPCMQQGRPNNSNHPTRRWLQMTPPAATQQPPGASWQQPQLLPRSRTCAKQRLGGCPTTSPHAQDATHAAAAARARRTIPLQQWVQPSVTCCAASSSHMQAALTGGLSSRAHVSWGLATGRSIPAQHAQRSKSPRGNHRAGRSATSFSAAGSTALPLPQG